MGKKMSRSTLLPIASFIAILGHLNAWEDHPDREDHRDQDRIYQDAQRETGARDWEKLAEREAISIERYYYSDRETDSHNHQDHQDDRGTWGPPDRDQ